MVLNAGAETSETKPYCDGSTNFDVDIREFTPKTRFKKNI